MQNEELRRTQLDLTAARDRFVDLYDFSPVGYLTLDSDGRVVEANLTGAKLLGEPRQTLISRGFARFVAPTDGDRWHRLWPAALQHDGAQRIEVGLKSGAGTSFHAQLDCLRVAAPGTAPQLRVTLTDITQRLHAETQRRVAASTVEAREAERRRVARELHEELGQRLSALKMELAGLPHAADASARQQRVEAMAEELDIAVAMVRRIASELRPLMIDDLGLNAALDWLARDSARRLGLAIALQLEDIDPALGERASISVYRILQEILACIARHSHGSDVCVEMRQRDGELLLGVRDNGPAAAGPSRSPEMAAEMPTLAQHARLLGGQLAFEATTGHRCFTLRLPLPGADGARGAGDGHAQQDPT